MSGIIASIKGQIIGGTNIDSQGERIPKHILEQLAQRKRTPLSQNHQPEKDSIGYMENFRVVPNPTDKGEWYLKADVFFTKEPDDIEIAIGGFSWSIIELIADYKALSESLFAIYLPYPYYNDESLLGQLHTEYKNMSLGRWYKKAADPVTTSLIIGFVCFVFSPAWAKFFDDIIWPSLKDALKSIPNIKSYGMQRVDFIQTAEIHGYQVSIYFIPEKDCEQICYSKDNIKGGLTSLLKFSQADCKSKNIGMRVAKLYWDKFRTEYRLFHVEYQDGTSLSLV